MASQDKALEFLLELGNPAGRPTRAELLERALRAALMLTDADASAILSPASRHGERLVLHAESTAPAVLPPPPRGSEVVRALAQNCQPLAFADLSDDARAAAADGCAGVKAGPVMFTPLRRRNPTPGYIAIYRRCGRARFTWGDTQLMLLLSAWLSMALESLHLSSGVERIALTDDLTEVYNSRFFKTALRREIRRASRFGQELSLIMIDVDNLKAYSDEHGDRKGGGVLKEVASVLAEQVRSFDVIAKVGDDEFMLILPQTARDGALEVAERMRAAVERHAFPLAPAGTVTVSLGVASFPQEGADGTALIATAGRALRQAKQRGRNCVETLVGRAA